MEIQSSKKLTITYPFLSRTEIPDYQITLISHCDSFPFRQQQAFQNNPESYNGAIRDGYNWAQSITDVDVRVKAGHIFTHRFHYFENNGLPFCAVYMYDVE